MQPCFSYAYAALGGLGGDELIFLSENICMVMLTSVKLVPLGPIGKKSFLLTQI